MNKNRIVFHDESWERFDWCRFNADSGKNETGHAEIEQLGRIFSPATPVTVYIPQQIILQTAAQMPPNASKQQLNAIAYAIEDQLADDVESCFFATLPQQSDGSVPVAVINQQKMDELTDVLAEYPIQVRLILPQIYLCPSPQEAAIVANICPIRDGFLVRTSLHQGLYCEAAVLSQVLKLISRQSDQKDQQMVCYGDVQEPLDIAGATLDRQPQFDPLTQDIDEVVCINLKQKQYQSSHQWLTVMRQWKWPAVALTLLLLVFISHAGVEIWQQKQLLEQLQQQQNDLLQQYLPELAGSTRPRLDLTKYLADNRASDQQSGFLDQLHEFIRLKEGLDQLEIGKIQFQKSSLVVDLESKDLKSLESLRSKLPQSGFKGRIDNVNISPEKTTGRLIMEGKS